MLNKNNWLEDSLGKYRSGQTIFVGNNPLYIRNVYIREPGTLLPEQVSIVLLIQRERKSLPSS